MQKKLMLRPTACPSENLPPEITDLNYIERSDSPENTSSSFLSMEQSESNITDVCSSPILLGTGGNNSNITSLINNKSENHDEVKFNEPHSTTPVQTISVHIQPCETLTTLSTVPFQEINQDLSCYTLYDGTEIDSYRLSSVLNKEDTGDGVKTYVLNFVDY